MITFFDIVLISKRNRICL